MSECASKRVATLVRDPPAKPRERACAVVPPRLVPTVAPTAKVALLDLSHLAVGQEGGSFQSPRPASYLHLLVCLFLPPAA